MPEKIVAFIVRLPEGSQGLYALDMEWTLADELGFHKDEIEVKEINPDAFEVIARDFPPTRESVEYK